MAMGLTPVVEKLQVAPKNGNQPFLLELPRRETIRIYPNSIQELNRDFFFIARKRDQKYLFILPTQDDSGTLSKFDSEKMEAYPPLKCCPLNHHNATALRELFGFTRPVLIGLQNSIGLGDRLGIANPAHLRAAAKSNLKPVLAQQSIRELQRTQRKPEEVMDAATWAVFQEGYKDGFGADADHLKTTDDIDLMVRAGFTMFTFDPGEYVVNEADGLPITAVEERIKALPWELLADKPVSFIERYYNQTLQVTEDLKLLPIREQVLRGLLKYGGVIAHAVRLHRYFKNQYPNHPAEFELSVDETDSVTSPFEHYLVANELKRLGVNLVSLAPRFVGDFEKGIDYKGDLEEFRAEYLKHVKIAERLGPYKISIHSGSDKFSVYQVIGSLKKGFVHVKTAGTSYLEALRTVAEKSPDLFREILDFARGLYESEKRTYRVSAKLTNVPSSRECSHEQLCALFNQEDARQVLHVTFGKVLTTRTEGGGLLFKDRIMNVLNDNEEAHYQNLEQHFRRHLQPFN